MDENIYVEELADFGKTSGIEKESFEQETEPFDPEQIKISSKVVSMDTLLRRLKSKTIKLSPDFQRNSVWNNTRKSQLIESMLLRIPLPMFYVSADEDGNWDVVDGLQRMSSILEYIYPVVFPDNFSEKPKKFENLEFWGNKFNNKTVGDLPTKYYNRILETEFNFTVIEPGTPELVKINVFKRINTGGMPLTSQEIRHALYNGESTKLLNKLVKDKSYLEATTKSINDDRMGGREIILRALAFLLLGYENYKGSDMESFLTDTMLLINQSNYYQKRLSRKEFSNNDILSRINSLENMFLTGIKRSYMIFGIHAFRRSLPDSAETRTPINKSLFELWIYIMSKLNETQFDSLLNNRKILFENIRNLNRNYNYYNSLSRDSWKLKGVNTRFSNTINMVYKIIEA